MTVRGKPGHWAPDIDESMDTDVNIGTTGKIPIEDGDTSFTSLEQHMFGDPAFDSQGHLYEPVEQTTMLHHLPSEADTVLQRRLDQPPPAQVVHILAPGDRPHDHPHEATMEGSSPGQLIAAGGVFAGMSFVAASGVVALGLVSAIIVYFALSPAPSQTLPPIGSPTGSPSADNPNQIAPAPRRGDPSPGRAPAGGLRKGVRFPATFAFNAWTPENLDETALTSLVGDIGSCNSSVRITGHTDARGPELVNDQFALARAGEVRRILQERGVDRANMEIGSAGAAAPVTDGEDPKGRAQNRRVTVQCL